jgi:GT2 family glycosyltransferase/glycosyltransferase involved in cell wall biosynthesis
LIEVPKRAFDALVMLHGIRLSRGVGRVFGVQKSLLAFEIQLTRELGLFDRDHYLSQLAPDALAGMSPLRHYVLIGDDQGLSPSPLFDTRHYDTRFRERHGINRLLHYGLVARFRGVSPTPWFDADYYLQSNPDVSASKIDALVHFQRWGWREGRSPLPGLDMRQLLSVQPELRVSKGSPLAMFSDGRFGDAIRNQLAGLGRRHPGLTVRASAALGEQLGQDLLEPARWAAVHPRQYDEPPRVDVVIPVYSGVQETLRCLWTVLTAPVDTPHHVVVINDAGPSPELNAMIRALAGRGLFQLEHHRQNQGFVRSVNHGMRQHKDRDVVILNADTEVYGNWLDRLVAHADEFPRVATVTPLSNNATICSYPETLNDNRSAIEISPAETDALAAQTNPLANVETPTGVGFCMFVRRTALREVGWLDDRRFGRGYGEENDLCQRLLRRGWSNVLACDVYVRHVGSVSFRSEASERTAKAMRTLAKLYPDYESQITRYIEADPAWKFRARLDLARLKRHCGQRNVLLVCHNRGGGTERHLLEQAQAMLGQGDGVFELRPSKRSGCVALMHPGLYGLHNLAVTPLDPQHVLLEALETLQIHEIHLHHLIDFPPATGRILVEASRRLGIALRISVHDYYAVCPRVNFVSPDGQYCGEPEDPRTCDRCLARDAMGQEIGPILDWRRRSLRLLEAAQHVVVPSADVARRLAKLSPALKVQVEPHEEPPPARAIPRPLIRQGETLRVLTIGAISRIKGYEILLGLAEAVRAQDAPVNLALLGYSADDTRLAAGGVEMLGRYFDNELQAKIAAYDPHVIFVPSIWPETYCYVLSSALASGRRVAVFDLGAQAERAVTHDADHMVFPLELAWRPAELLDTLLAAARASDRYPQRAAA